MCNQKSFVFYGRRRYAYGQICQAKSNLIGMIP